MIFFLPRVLGCCLNAHRHEAEQLPRQLSSGGPSTLCCVGFYGKKTTWASVGVGGRRLRKLSGLPADCLSLSFLESQRLQCCQPQCLLLEARPDAEWAGAMPLPLPAMSLSSAPHPHPPHKRSLGLCFFHSYLISWGSRSFRIRRLSALVQICKPSG